MVKSKEREIGNIFVEKIVLKNLLKMSPEVNLVEVMVAVSIGIPVHCEQMQGCGKTQSMFS